MITFHALTHGAAYRLSREAASHVIEADPGLMELLSRNLAERNLSREAKASETTREDPALQSEGLAKALLKRMVSVFR